MKDSVTPQIVVKTEQQIDITFNPVGLSSSPIISQAVDQKPSNIIAETTQTLVENQGYTYSDARWTYSQAGINYGGIYNVDQDLSPIFANDVATLLSPSISGIIDIGTQPTTLPNHYQSVGPGWFLYVTKINGN